MTERGVSEAEVEATVLTPDSWEYGEDGELIAAKKIGRYTIRVAYLSLPEAPKILTVMVE